MSLLSNSAFAQFQDNLYIGFGIGKTAFDIYASDDTKYKKNSYEVLIGKRLTNNISVELQYVNFAHAVFAVVDSVPETFSGKSIGVSSSYYFLPTSEFMPFVNRLAPFIKLGAGYANLDFSDESASIDFSANEDTFHGFAGVGLDSKLDYDSNITYRIEYQYLGGLGTTSVGLLFDY
jgi:hypothetical protein